MVFVSRVIVIASYRVFPEIADLREIRWRSGTALTHQKRRRDNREELGYVKEVYENTRNILNHCHRGVHILILSPK